MIIKNCNKTNKKGQMNKIFIYLLSIIMIVFIGFLVAKFIGLFSENVNTVTENKFYNEFEKNFNIVYTTSGSEKFYKYKVSQEVHLVCFVSKKACIQNVPELNNNNLPLGVNDSIAELADNKHNIVMLDKNDILNSRSIPNINIEENGGCFCINPKQGYFDLLFENIRNKVWISKKVI